MNFVPIKLFSNGQLSLKTLFIQLFTSGEGQIEK